MFRIRIALAVLLASCASAGPAFAVDNYEACLSLVDSSPQKALDEAMAWTDLGGGVPARHCAGLAMKQLGHYADAAQLLELLARDNGAGNAATRAEILAQAGNAWILQHEPQKAYDDLSEALRLEPGNRDMLIDRARAAALGEDFKSATKDLDQVLAKTPNDIDALILRSNARRDMGDLKGAKVDADLAVAKGDKIPDAWVERGIVKHFLGDEQGARADWRVALKLAPDGQAGLDAQALLERSSAEAPSKTP